MYVRLLHMKMWEEELIIRTLLLWIIIPVHPSDGLAKWREGIKGQLFG